MKYTIVTTHPKAFRDEVIKRIKECKDSKDASIETWEIIFATFKDNEGKEFKEEVLVHNTKAWKDVGGIRLIIDKDGNSQVHVRFFYWVDYPKDQRDDSQELYMYGRLTELLLAHFNEDMRSIMMTEVDK